MVTLTIGIDMVTLTTLIHMCFGW